ncbi:MAG: GTP 3',8-cyclase MoaA [Nanoarchaeota archaeon]|nr:GTP 3',8-cyclase MoaA [Nanoarchaeota archaeon]
MPDTQDLSQFFLRFAITPKCNFRCYYCNPEGKMENAQPLDDESILQIMKAGFMAGVNRAHWTGGEPTLKDMQKLISETKRIGYAEQVLTTNGSCGGDYVKEMADAGLNRLIISLDTLDPGRFKQITKRDCLEDVIDTIKTAVEIFEEPTKMNVVYLDGTRSELPELIKLGGVINANPKNKGTLIVKLIEMTEMNPVFFTENGKQLYEQQHTGREVMRKELERFGTLEPVKAVGNNPNTHYFYIPEAGIKVGMINIPSQDYRCGGKGCAKIRLNPYGMIAVCVNQKPININGMSEERQTGVIKGLMSYRDVIDKEMPHRKHKQQGNFGYWRFGNCGNLQNK